MNSTVSPFQKCKKKIIKISYNYSYDIIISNMHYSQNMENSYFNSTFVYNAIYSFVPSANSIMPF